MGYSPQLWTKTYNIPNGVLEIKIHYDNYWRPNDFLDFNLIDDIEFEYGYEDEDQLTFYPNIVRLKFDDYKKRNYDILKLSVGDYNNTLPENHMEYGGVEIWLNGALKFKGYIDDLTLRYNEKDMNVEFEVICLTVDLRNMAVDRDKIIDENGNRVNDNWGVPLKIAWYGVYKQLWPDFVPYVYPISSINNPNLFGTFIRHDWCFEGSEPGSTIIRNWADIPDFEQTYFILDSTDLYGPNRPARTWAEYLRLIALQFGAIIGVMDYGQVYFIKRFLNNNPVLIDISDRVIEDNFSKQIHLPVLRGVAVVNHWNGERGADFGNIEKTSNGDYKYIDRVKKLDTYIGSYVESGSRGTAIYANDNNYLSHPVWHVWDPQLGGSANGGQCWELVGKWQWQSRMAPKDMVEVDLTGIDYNMVDIYRITPPGTQNLAVNFRAMTMKKSLLKNKTHIVGIEV